MTSAGTVLIDGAGAREGDAAAVAAGDDRATLMARAAGHLARGVVASCDGAYGRHALVVVGRGDNGGDGWSAAPLLARRGMKVTVLAPDGLEAPGSPETVSAREAWLHAGGRAIVDPDRAPARPDVVIDAVLGTGAAGPLRGAAVGSCAAVGRARDSGARVVACDLPSGVSADDGSAAEGAVVADVTVTFGALKRGLLLHPGAARAGRIVLGRLGASWRAPDGGWSALDPTSARAPARAPDDEKRRRGTVLVVAGGPSTAGAAVLAGRGALAAGVGLLTVATPAAVTSSVAAQQPAMMVLALPSDAHGALSAGAEHALPDADVVVAGPGLGIGAPVADLVRALLERPVPLVLDADALNVVRDDPDVLARHAGPLVLTPHARELARLGGGSDAVDALTHRVTRAAPLAERLGATLVVKGPGTLVVAPDGRHWVAPLGSPALATGGTGDVLAGLVGAAIAADPDDVALSTARAVWWHAAAGVLAGARAGCRTDASRVAEAIPAVLARLAGWPVPRPVSATGVETLDVARFVDALVEQGAR
ncbi:MAG: hypothetical protein RLZZ272_1555 [Actinomycetota bacterium]